MLTSSLNNSQNKKDRKCTVMNIAEAREKVGMSRKEVSEWLEIPYRTMCGWENGERTCPAYVEKLIIEKILRGKDE